MRTFLASSLAPRGSRHVLERYIGRTFFFLQARSREAWTTTTTTKRVERWSVGGGDGNGGIPRPFRPLPPPLTTRPNPYRSNLPPFRPLPFALPSSPPLPSVVSLPAPRRASLRLAAPRRHSVLLPYLPPSPEPSRAAPRRAAPRRSAPRRHGPARHPHSARPLRPASTWDARRGCEVADNAEIPPRRGSWHSASQPRTYTRDLLALALALAY